MRYFGVLLIPLLVVLIFAGPGCQQAQDEPEVQVEQAVEESAEAPVAEKAPAAIEEVEFQEEVAVDVVEPEKEGSEILKQLQEKGEEEAQKQAEEHEVDKKIDELGM